MPVEEGLALIHGLQEETTSQLFIKVNNWKFPFSTESRILADLFDTFAKANTPKKHQSKLKAYPRPFDLKKKTVISGAPISLEEAKVKYARIQARLSEVIPK